MEKLWEIDKNAKVFTNVNDLLKYIKGIDGKFDQRREFERLFQSSFNENTTEADSSYFKNAQATDKEHPIVYSFFKVYINEQYFNEHKEEFRDLYQEYIKSIDSNPFVLTIPDWSMPFDKAMELTLDERFKKTRFNYYLTGDNSLTDEQIQKIKDLHLGLDTVKNGTIEKISSDKAISFLSFNDIKEQKVSILYRDLNLSEADNFRYIGGLDKPGEVLLNHSYLLDDNEKENLEKAKQLFSILGTHNKTYNIRIAVTGRKSLRESKILETLPNNINLEIDRDFNVYALEEYKQEEKQIDNLVDDIKAANLSPLERYIAAYNKIKQFKKYKENNESILDSRQIKDILTNEYITCGGFSKLLEDTLELLDVPITRLDTNVDISYDQGFDKSDKTVKTEGHARCMVKIDDDKYNVHGIYISDPTWDNDLDEDLYNNCLLTFDHKKEAYRLERIEDFDLFFDAHNEEEFHKKYDYYIESQITKHSRFSRRSYKELVLQSHSEYFRKSLRYLKSLDPETFTKFYEKYAPLSKLNEAYYRKENMDQLFKLFDEYLVDLSSYAIPRVNNKVSDETIFDAASVVKSKVNGLKGEELDNWKKRTIESNAEMGELKFPYRYDPSNPTEAYLELNEDGLSR